MLVKTLEVREINEYIKKLMDTDVILRNIHVKGEISNLKYHSSAIYFTLKDEFASLKCVMFNEFKNKLNYDLEDGMSVIVAGRISVYEKNGTYQLYVNNIQPDGIGTLYIAFNKLKDKLKNEGLFDINKKKPLPQNPKKIGVITSPTGAAIRDIISIAKRRNPAIDILIAPVLVQGNTAADEICHALEILNKRDDIEVIILGRGGGSLEEIWPFNEEKVARAIYASKIPVVSAVGHETDYTISDFVADLRAPTPSAAAELVVADINIYKKDLINLRLKLIKLFSNYLKYMKKNIYDVKERLYLNSPIKQSKYLKNKLANLKRIMYKSAITAFNEKKSNFLRLTDKLNSLSPLNVLNRGYTIVINEQKEEILTSVKSIHVFDNIKIIFCDGFAKGYINEVHKNG